jgi:hypothetical protein
VRRTGFSATARYQAAVAQQPTGVAEDGLGDRAWYLEEAAKLWVLQRDDLVTLEVAVPDPGRARSVAVELAAAAVRRLRDDDRAD